MMLLFGTTITASFFDSLNPSAIAQQMLLQAMVKNKRHIWFFIIGIGSANLLLGLAVYYGIATWVFRLLALAVDRYPLWLFGAALLFGAVCLAVGIGMVIRTGKSAADFDETEAGKTKAPAQLSPLSLFLMGAAFCAVELTSALPYFGFLAVLTNYHLSFLPVIAFVMLYDFIYVLPLILLYFGYNRLQGTVVIRKLEQILGRVSSYIVPVVISLLGVFLLSYGGTSLI